MTRNLSSEDDVSYPSFVTTDAQRSLYNACLREMTTGAGALDVAVAEFAIEQQWPTLLGLLHRMHHHQEGAKNSPQKAN